MIDDRTNGALATARTFSEQQGQEEKQKLERFLELLSSYYYSYDETVCIIEAHPTKEYRFIVFVNRPTKWGPKLVEVLDLRFVLPEKPIEDHGVPTVRPEPPTPGWHLLSCGFKDTTTSPYRRERL